MATTYNWQVYKNKISNALQKMTVRALDGELLRWRFNDGGDKNWNKRKLRKKFFILIIMFYTSKADKTNIHKVLKPMLSALSRLTYNSFKKDQTNE
jgi:hypothetical protein